jgi:DNA-binding CsgD family transcriptional regulator
MSFLKRVLSWLGLFPTPGSRYYEIDEGSQMSLRTLADYEGRSEHELLPDVLAAGFDQYRSDEAIWRKWESLTSREKDVTALMCLGMKNREIAVYLTLSPETVKTHIHNVFTKFDVKSRNELRYLLRKWNFSN